MGEGRRKTTRPDEGGKEVNNNGRDEEGNKSRTKERGRKGNEKERDGGREEEECSKEVKKTGRTAIMKTVREAGKAAR